MLMLVMFLLAVVGLTNTFVHGKIMHLLGIRPFLKENLSPEVYEGTECNECVGFWAGLILGFFYAFTFEGYQFFLVWLFSPFAGSYVSGLASDLYMYMSSQTGYVINDEQ